MGCGCFVSLCEGAGPGADFFPQVSPSMFWDFGSLHQEPRVGGPLGCVRRDGSDGWDRWSAGRQYLGVRSCISTANHRLPVPPTGCEHRGALWIVYEMASPVLPDGYHVTA